MPVPFVLRRITTAASAALIAIGFAACGEQVTPVAPALTPTAPSRLVVPTTGYTQVATGKAHSCALAGAGAITCWGDNGYGQLNAPAGAGYAQVSAGYTHACALTAAGAISCWGDNLFGQLNAPSGAGYTQLSAGVDFICAVSGAGTLACWGSSNHGKTTPPAGTGFTRVSAGKDVACALTNTGAASCWGNNGAGQATPPTTHVYPTATFTAPAADTALRPFPLALSGAQVPGHPEATAFTYAFDCGDGQGYAAASSTASTTCAAPTAAGPRTVRGKVIDQDGDTAAYSATVTVKGTQTVAFTSAAPNPAYVGAVYTANAAATSGRLPTLSVLTPATCAILPTNPLGTPLPVTVLFTAAGPCTLAADEGGDASYTPAPRTTQTIVVTLRPQTIAFTTTPPSLARVGGTYAVAATGGASGNAVTFTSRTPTTCGVSGNVVSFTAAGGCTVVADQLGTAAYAAAEATQAITVIASFPATPVLDAFARADGALGPNWGGFSSTSSFRITGQQGVVVRGGGIGWAPAAFGTTQEAFVTLTNLGRGGSSAQGLVLKGQNPADHTLGALTVTYQPQQGTVVVTALRSPPATVTAYPALAVSLAAGDQLGARITASGMVTVYRNGMLVGTVTLGAADQAYFAGRGGYVGLAYVGAGGAAFDNFGGGSVTP